jgi:acetyl esterase/lipase
LTILTIAFASFLMGGLTARYYSDVKDRLISSIKTWRDGDPDEAKWPDGFAIVHIPSSVDGTPQPAYYASATPPGGWPLVVSLHSWSRDYSWPDPLAEHARHEGWNYIHPEFRGPNRTMDACLSEKALADIDDAIQYANDHGPVDRQNIFVVGMSGGGYAALGAYLKSRHPVRLFIAWSPISDLVAWFYQSQSRGTAGYAEDILRCTSQGGPLDEQAARSRSPLFWDLPAVSNGRLELYAGINDGYAGSVPISHAILFFNRLAAHHGFPETRVKDTEIAALLSRGVTPHAELSTLDDRPVLFTRDTPPVALTIFKGRHEMLFDYTFERFRKIAEPRPDLPRR